MEWISVDDRLPDDNQDVLAYCSGQLHPATHYKGVFESSHFLFHGRITPSHWMSLPEPPKQS